jgi:predicted HD superfamily hydrolase involved in NAD metabolism
VHPALRGRCDQGVPPRQDCPRGRGSSRIAPHRLRQDREGDQKGRPQMAQILGPEEILDEIRIRLRRDMSADTYAHVERTAEVAKKLAVAHGEDPERAELAALVHDIADGYSERELLTLAERYGVPVSLTEARVPKLLHGKIGAEILRESGVRDEELLDAVRDHITGGVRMSRLAKITFVADKIEPNRDRHYGGLEHVREIAMTDLDEAILQLYAWRIDTLVGEGRPVDDNLTTSRNHLIERMLARGR